MYTATMLYQFKKENFDAACNLWEDEVAMVAKGHPGFVRMQLLASSPKALAIGTWESNDDARKFMETGAFKRLMSKLEGMVVDHPQQSIWDLKSFVEK